MPKTSEALAVEYKVDEKTIRRDAKYAEAVDTIAKTSCQATKQAILSGELSELTVAMSPRPPSPALTTTPSP